MSYKLPDLYNERMLARQNITDHDRAVIYARADRARSRGNAWQRIDSLTVKEVRKVLESRMA